ncbi:2-dehydro-3-deoxy-6-phosphogalactonate aldolase [Amorphus orientalis]|uniref:2-dehydro-3-deoxyphosphogalactonate aldolase n=1 Tax=Amorphus orientalis TaxID=649198 RepID=A0AAE3VMN9_9HYPH|nr:2-dehydro-3-deoxy-6-phosphogalactonate aldolase [Amorphus orientalis]MDQ0314496.1 2-dehydro-3-deoxyphosphogalactonate aldolase [Amorphus orientalis]
MIDWDAAFAELPLVAILRGLEPDAAEATVGALVDAGFRIIEVPLNSPTPFRSIEIAARRFGGEAVIGAGTVLDPTDVSRVAQAGGRLIVAPNFDAAVGRAALADACIWCPGVFSPTEAFAALKAGAHGLKLFPGELIPPSGVKALRAVLPPETRVLVVGGVSTDAMGDYIAAGADGFGIGSALFKPGLWIDEIARRAIALKIAWNATGTP